MYEDILANPHKFVIYLIASIMLGYFVGSANFDSLSQKSQIVYNFIKIIVVSYFIFFMVDYKTYIDFNDKPDATIEINNIQLKLLFAYIGGLFTIIISKHKGIVPAITALALIPPFSGIFLIITKLITNKKQEADIVTIISAPICFFISVSIYVVFIETFISNSNILYPAAKILNLTQYHNTETSIFENYIFFITICSISFLYVLIPLLKRKINE